MQKVMITGSEGLIGREITHFLKKNGYKVEEKSHLLFNKVQHWLMKKNLKLL